MPGYATAARRWVRHASRFHDRRYAGRQLGAALAARQLPNPLVLGLPRGGVPVAYEVARSLGAPLDVLVVRKLGHPQQPELALGAVASGGVRVLNPAVMTDVSAAELEAITARERAEVESREERYRRGRPAVDPAGHTAILVDDGLATGATMRAAVMAVRERSPAAVVVAVPVAPRSALGLLADQADDIVCLARPAVFFAVGQCYDDFAQVTDEEVAALLDAAGR